MTLGLTARAICVVTGKRDETECVFGTTVMAFVGTHRVEKVRKEGNEKNWRCRTM